MGSSHLHRDGGAEAEAEVKTGEAQSPPVVAQQQGPPAPHAPKRQAKPAAHDDDDDAPPTAELLGVELARLRARSAVDPSVAERSLEPAWARTAGSVEDDEAEFLDAMADCVGAGLSLDTALACWHTGELAYDPEGSADDADDGAAADASAVIAPHQPGTGRRLFVR